MADSKEAQFQNEIIDYLTNHGWLEGENANYNQELALYPEDVIGFYTEAFPEDWEKFQKMYPKDNETALLKSVAKQLDKHAKSGAKDESGVLSVLRHGFKDRGAKVRLAQFKPDHNLNETILKRYKLNRLRVVQEVVYSPHDYEGRIDLVLFLNGIPIATLELKSMFKQSIENAKKQYKRDRPPIDPKTKKAEPLLTFKRGALVHFAVDQKEVWMTTKLEGKDTYFLPFNKGMPDGSPENPSMEGEYDTAYLWQEVFEWHNLLKVIGRFIHLQRKDEENPLGKKVTKETMIFPRYHQWDVVTQLIDSATENGAGQHYLVQHSAGSGKSNSIAWTAHQLASIYDKSGEKLFQSVIVITDRTVLDKQLQETIYQFDHKDGVVARITREEGTDSKSTQLVEALEKGTPIIIVTLQTFPFVLDAIQKRTTLKDHNFAIIADEAHSSQSGRTAIKIRQVLTSEQLDSDEDLSSEDILNALLAARRRASTLSYFAFTATPKSKTLELFGQLPNPELPSSEDNKPEAFHVYTMHQAIKEGFILDVLKNYTSYETAYKLARKDEKEDSEVPSRKASREVTRWFRLHPYHIGQRAEVIVEHFREKVAPLLGGQAKAMIVTSGRKDAVRYKLAVDAYVQKQGYTDVNALVAFSGRVTEHPQDLEEKDPNNSKPISYDLELASKQSKASQKEIGKIEFGESSMNPKAKGDLRTAFDSDSYNIMIVANKFQTGFDQPKLVAMYVDKKLGGVEAVQTLSRLNRTTAGKDTTYVLDFVNDPDDIQKAFEPYYKTTILTEVSDPNIVYDLFEKLREMRIYQWDEVEDFAEVFFDPKGSQADLTTHIKPAAERYRERYREASDLMVAAQKEKERSTEVDDEVGYQNAQRDEQHAKEAMDEVILFKKDLQGFSRFYEFMSQVIAYDDEELEKLSVFARHLQPLLRQVEFDEDEIDISNVTLSHYRLTKQKEQDIKLGQSEGVKGTTDVGSGRPKDDEDEWLSEVLQRLNSIYGSDVGDTSKLNFAKTVADTVIENDRVMEQIKNNSPEQVMLGDFPEEVKDAMLQSGQTHQKMMLEVLGDEQKAEVFIQVVLDLVLKSIKGMKRF